MLKATCMTLLRIKSSLPTSISFFSKTLYVFFYFYLVKSLFFGVSFTSDAVYPL